MEHKNTSEAINIGKAIRHIRGDKRLSRESLSLDANVDSSTIERLESGAANPTIGTIKKLADVLDTDLPSLLLIGDKLKRSEYPSLRQIVAKNIRSTRQTLGWSQQYLASKANMGIAYLGRVERGEASVSIDKIELLSIALNIHSQYLMREDVAESPEKYLKTGLQINKVCLIG